MQRRQQLERRPPRNEWLYTRPRSKNDANKLCAISCDDVDSHVEWIKDICASQGCAELGFPIIADPSRELITMLGMIGAPLPAMSAWSPAKPHLSLQFAKLPRASAPASQRVMLSAQIRKNVTRRGCQCPPVPCVHPILH